MWLIASGAAACAGLTLLGAFWEEGAQHPRSPYAPEHGFYRRDDGVFVDEDGNVVDVETQARLGTACSELQV